MAVSDALDRGRNAVSRSAWGDAYTALSDADRRQGLVPTDIELLARAARLTGRDAESGDLLARAHQRWLEAGDATRAARCAFWLAMALFERGDMAQGGGWLARAERALEDAGECVERGYVLLPRALQSLGAGDAGAALMLFREAADIASRFREADLTVLAQLGQGRSLITLGEPLQGVALLDEAMVAVTAGEVEPAVTGIVYCAVIEACQELFDLGRAREWTAALNRWCESQPDLMPYRGQCLVYRAELMQLAGAWQDALAEVQRAQQQLQTPQAQPAIGEALYRQAELHRLRGEFEEAQACYRQASASGRQAEPGIALLRLAQGQPDVAQATSRRALGEARAETGRARLLAAHGEIMLAAGDVEAARVAAEELSAIATHLNSPLLVAQAAYADGAVRLATDDALGAISSLRRASAAWQALNVPYEAARARVLIALCCRQLGDEQAAQMELEGARTAFRELGAIPDCAHVEGLLLRADTPKAGALTERELDVLRLIATGKTNRGIALELVISEKTVARHVSNIFAKLGLSSRAAATAYAYEHALLSPSA
jgi:ATP/maltotriose-dependent transcriptional regulator MalT